MTGRVNIQISRKGEKLLARGEEVDIHEFVCEKCGVSVVAHPRRNGRRFCSRECYQRFHAQKNNQRRRQREVIR